MAISNSAEAGSAPVDRVLCEGDTRLVSNLLPPALAAGAFERLLSEVAFASMSHLGGDVPRRIAVQGTVDPADGSMPIYRHPADESPPLVPFSPTVLAIKGHVERHTGHPVNHCLIQHYRTGGDYISEHSDKTLDIVPETFICNVSLGAERTMILRTKKPDACYAAVNASGDGHGNAAEPCSPTATANPRREIQRAPLPHNSLLLMGLRTNRRWLHAIKQDRRSDADKTAAQRLFSGARISLTFRLIGTFVLPSAPTITSPGQQQQQQEQQQPSLIWGQGATGKTRADAHPVVNGQTAQAVRLVRAFGRENHSADFVADDAETGYGGGFDVLHMGTPKRLCVGTAGSGPGLFSNRGRRRVAATVTKTQNACVFLGLAELGVPWARGVTSEGRPPRFEDNDPGRAFVEGYDDILSFLWDAYGPGRRNDQVPQAQLARRIRCFRMAVESLSEWRDALAATLDEDEINASAAGAEPMGLLAQCPVEPVKTCSLVKRAGVEIRKWVKVAEEAEDIAWEGRRETKDGEGLGGPADSEASSSPPLQPLYIAGGNHSSPADYALWPVLHDMVRVCGQDAILGTDLEQRGSLTRYYHGLKARSTVSKVLQLSGEQAS